jgi:hypothetical protein
VTDPHPLALILEGLVPLALLDLQSRGGPTAAEYAAARAVADEVAEHADVLLYSREASLRERKATRGLLGRLAWALAVMAYCPGGSRFGDLRWDAGVGR